MSVFTFFAEGDLAPTYSVGDTVQFEIGLSILLPVEVTDKTRTQAQSGFSQTWVNRLSTNYKITTVQVNSETDDKYAILKMFVASITGGQQFGIDFDGTILVPSANNGNFEIDTPPMWSRNGVTDYLGISFEAIASV